MKLLGNLKRGICFIVSAPAGSGKTTLVKMLTEEFSCIKASVSFTTRAQRKGEIDGVHYHFISKEKFEKKISNGDFLEYAVVFGEYYGTCKKTVLEGLDKGIHVILVIDTQGALLLKPYFPAIYIFITPPSMEELKSRLVARKTESFEALTKRLDWSQKEMEMAKQYDYLLINDELPMAYQILRSIIISEEHRIKKN